MTMIEETAGCKVGWKTFDNEQEAERCSFKAAVERDRKFAKGYDFGYLWPGAITHHELHPKFGVECWTVVVP